MALWSIGRIPVPQTGEAGFDSSGSCCDHRTMAVRQIVDLHTRGSIPPGHPMDELPRGEGS